MSEDGGITPGPDGNLWLAVWTRSRGNEIAKLTPAGMMTVYPLPAPANDELQVGGLVPLDFITSGPDGNIWMPDFWRMDEITTAGAVTTYPIPHLTTYGPRSITTGPDGNLWYTETDNNHDVLGRITTSGVVTEWNLAPYDSPVDVTAGPDGNLWVLQDDSITKVAPSGAILAEYSLPTSDCYPSAITVGPDGNLWFTETDCNAIGRITMQGAISEFPIPTRLAPPVTSTMPTGITRGPDGDLWFTENRADQIGCITPSGVITDYSLPEGTTSPQGITALPDGTLWFDEWNFNYPTPPSIYKIIVP